MNVVQKIPYFLCNNGKVMGKLAAYPTTAGRRQLDFQFK